MNSSADQKIATFTEALQLPEGKRAAYLEQACGGDEELCRAVQALLQEHTRVGDFLEESPNSSLAQAKAGTVVAEKAGDYIGGYRLLKLIGEGGCGVVFMAEQTQPVHRKVALKIIKPGMDTKSVIARFEAERQALALMDHPNIAKIFEAGATQSGRPYFVMELVDGVKITDYCDEHRLPTEARLGLFARVCEAVQHAHQKGIIHRDIKPSNVLIATERDGEPTPKVIDFGVAKATDGQRLTNKTIVTGHEMLIGTPDYMSPEQAALSSAEVDTRTDIYSLGALLYELLTGTTPFDTRELLKTGIDEVRRVIRDEEPARPSVRLTMMTASDVLSVSKCHRAEPRRLIRQMRGDLDCIVMKALEKDRSRRYATANGFALDVGRYLSGETILARPPSTWHQFQKLVERNQLLFGAISAIAGVLVIGFVAVTLAFARERAARHDAEADKIKSEEVTQFFRKIMSGAGPSTARTRDTTVLRQMLDEATKQLDVELTNQPEVQADLRFELGRVYADIGQNAEAEAMFRQALKDRVGLGEGESEAASDVTSELGKTLTTELKLEEAESSVRQALAARQKLFGKNNLKVAECYTEMGTIYWMRRQLPEAETMLSNSLAMHRQFHGDDSPWVGDARIGLGSVFFSQGRYREAEQLFGQAMTNWEKALGPNHPSVILAANDLAAALGGQERYTEAAALFQRVVATRRKLFGEDHPAVASSLGSLSRMQYRLKRYDEAEATAREGLTVARKVWGDTNADTLVTLRDLVNSLMAQRKFEETERVFADILPDGAELKPENANLLYERCETEARCNRWRKAADDAEILVRESPDTHEYYHTLAPLLVRLGEVAADQKLCRTIVEKFSGTTDIHVADRMAKDCLTLPSSGVDLKSVAAMAELAATRGSNDPAAPYFHFTKGLAEFRLGRYEAAMKSACLATNGTFPTKASATAVLAMCQSALNRVDNARTALSECSQIVEEHMPKPERDQGSQWRDWIVANALESAARRTIDGESASAARLANGPR